MTWYMDKGPDSDVILSSRVRLARNLCDRPFPNKLDSARAAALSQEVADAFLGDSRDRRADYLDVDLGCLPEQDRMALAEKRLISEDLARFGECRRAIISRDESVSVMVNEEDHIRIQAMAAGFALDAAYRKAEAVALLLEERLPIAWSDKYGFLTACPTNTGTGMRASAMAHLPGLAMAGLLRGAIESLGKMGFAVRGNYGEHSQASGLLFQISNQITLGLGEDELLTDLKRVVGQLVAQERKARKSVYDKDPVGLDDRASRALGLLRSARRMGSEEAMQLISDVRLGLALRLVDGVTEESLNRAIVSIGPASVQKSAGHPMGEAERDVERARTLHSILT